MIADFFCVLYHVSLLQSEITFMFNNARQKRDETNLTRYNKTITKKQSLRVQDSSYLPSPNFVPVFWDMTSVSLKLKETNTDRHISKIYTLFIMKHHSNLKKDSRIYTIIDRNK